LSRITNVLRSLTAALLVTLLVPRVADARVVRLEITERDIFAGGVSWGSAGPYERLAGTAHFEVDPRDPLNAVIVDLDLAPRNARGAVEFRTTFFILKPVDIARGNGKIYYTINNRGNDALFNARTVADVGRNDFPLRLGYTIVDAGWQGDLAPSATRLGATLPIAMQPDGSPIVGLTRVEFSDRNMPIDGAFTFNLKGSAAFRAYEAADSNTSRATLTVRDSVAAPRTPIAADRWAFGSCPTGQSSLVPSRLDVCHFDRFQPGKLYELIYAARNPIVMGLGHATTRDFASFLRYAAGDEAGNPNPLRPTPSSAAIRRVYATGASQTGGFIRDFIYLGFNEDEAHRRVFDGVIPTIAGTDRVFINVRFSDPNVYSGQEDRHDFLQNSYPPFTYAVVTDPISGVTDGILKRPATDPFVLQADSATEFWQLRASLNTVDGKGRPVPIPPNVRLYFVSSTSHGFGVGGLIATAGRNPRCANPTPSGVNDLARPLLLAMDAWADQGTAPPESNYPRLDAGTLVPVEEARQAFPDIPGVVFPTTPNPLRLLDFGPQFGRSGGILALQPPLQGASYPVLVPKPDRDGFDIAGVQPIQVRVPLGTITGWNVRTVRHQPVELCGLSGSYLPFAKTMTERQSTGDPRRSLEERYRSHAGFVEAVAKATRELVSARFLHPDDAQRYIEAARASDVLK
jgi:hypothetical protein